MRDQSPQHLCRQGRRCKARVRDGEGQFDGAGVERPDSLCRPCEDGAFEAVWQLYNDWEALAVALTEPSTTTDSGQLVSRSAGHPIPLRVDVDAVMTDMVCELVRWVRVLTKGDPLPTNAGECVKRCVAILVAHKGTLVDLPRISFSEWNSRGDGVTVAILDGVDAVLRLAKLHGRALAALGSTPTRIWLPDPCPVCGRKSLSPSENQERISCQGCHVVWDAKQFAFLGNVLDFERRSVKA